MRSAAVLILVAATLAGCGDRRSAAGAQGNASATAVPPASPDEAAPAAPAAPVDKVDRSHAGQPAPTLGFVDPAGKPVTLADYRGTPVLLNLWATWCGPCVKELPTLDALAAREKGKLQVITLSQDLEPAKATAFLADRHFAALKSWIDPKMAWVPAVTSNLPTSILVGRDGKEVLRVVGDMDWTSPAAAALIASAS